MSEIIAALLGTCVGGLFPYWSQKQERCRQKEAILCSLAAEILAICNFIRMQHLPLRYAAAADCVDTGQTLKHMPLDAKYNYFTVFEALGPRLGELGGEVAAKVVTFYTHMKLILETSRSESHFRPSAQNFRYLSHMSQVVLDAGDEICKLAKIDHLRHV